MRFHDPERYGQAKPGPPRVVELWDSPLQAIGKLGPCVGDVDADPQIHAAGPHLDPAAVRGESGRVQGEVQDGLG